VSFRVGYGGGSRVRERMTARAWVIALFGVWLLGFPGPNSSALAHGAPQASNASTPVCRGKVRRLQPGHVSFLFTCGESEDITGFVLRANRPLHSVYDPSFAFGCERSTSRAFDCDDIHSGAGPEGSGVALMSEPLCHPHAHLVLWVTPTLNFEEQSLSTFTMKGPC
jgi:hypothetical protein